MRKLHVKIVALFMTFILFTTGAPANLFLYASESLASQENEEAASADHSHLMTDLAPQEDAYILYEDVRLRETDKKHYQMSDGQSGHLSERIQSFRS